MLTHGNAPTSLLPEKQSQADLLRYLKQLIQENLIQSRFKWVEGHTVEQKGWANCNLEERLNDKSDTLAKRVLKAGYMNEDYINHDLPFR